jgi:hypothetical protein
MRARPLWRRKPGILPNLVLRQQSGWGMGERLLPSAWTACSNDGHGAERAGHAYGAREEPARSILPINRPLPQQLPSCSRRSILPHARHICAFVMEPYPYLARAADSGNDLSRPSRVAQRYGDAGSVPLLRRPHRCCWVRRRAMRGASRAVLEGGLPSAPAPKFGACLQQPPILGNSFRWISLIGSDALCGF